MYPEKLLQAVVVVTITMEMSLFQDLTLNIRNYTLFCERKNDVLRLLFCIFNTGKSQVK